VSVVSSNKSFSKYFEPADDSVSQADARQPNPQRITSKLKSQMKRPNSLGHQSSHVESDGKNKVQDSRRSSSV
jgi:hypothetical protein